MLRSSSTIGASKTLSPNSELARINKIVANRRLYNGDFRELGLEPVSSVIPGISVNWFKKVAMFYPDFMFTEPAEIEIEGNERASEVFSEALPHMQTEVMAATTNMIRYGVGVITTRWDDPTMFISVDPDRWYEVGNTLEEVVQDIFYWVVGNQNENDRVANVYRYGVDGSAILQQFNYNHGNLGNQTNTVDIPQRSAMRQAVFMENIQDERASVYDLIKGPLGQMSRANTAVAKNINRNSHPHLYGPDTMLARDEAGRVNIDNEGMFLPLVQGDEKPGYLHWDSNILSTKWSYEENEALFFSFTGLSKLIFSNAINTGALSGIALRRSLIPFISTLNRYGNEAINAIKSMVILMNENRRVIGDEYFEMTPQDITVTLNYDKVFQDAAEQRQGGPEPETPLTGAGSLSS